MIERKWSSFSSNHMRKKRKFYPKYEIEMVEEKKTTLMFIVLFFGIFDKISFRFIYPKLLAIMKNEHFFNGFKMLNFKLKKNRMKKVAATKRLQISKRKKKTRLNNFVKLIHTWIN